MIFCGKSQKRKQNEENVKNYLKLLKNCYIIAFVPLKNKDIGFAPLAHLVEHLTLNQGVQGSSPWRRTQRYRFYGRMSHRVGAFLL